MNNHVGVRLTTSLLERIERVQELVSDDPRLVAFAISSRSVVIRMALERGLRELEKEYENSAAAGTTRSSRKARQGA